MKNLEFDVLLKTDDYSLFKKIKGNRNLDEVNVKRIMESMQKHYLPTIVIVNENMEVIDGQHRVEACTRLKNTIYYMAIKGLTLDDVILYNSIQKSWQKPQFLESQIDLGNQSYLWLYEFMKVYPEFSLGTSESILTNTYGGANKNKGIRDSEGKLVGKRLLFQHGQLNITMENKVQGYEIAAKICEYKPYFKKYNTGVFVKTMINLFQNPKFNHEKMLKQIEKQQTKMVQCANVKQYKLLLQEIYNYNSKGEKVALYP